MVVYGTMMRMTSALRATKFVRGSVAEGQRAPRTTRVPCSAGGARRAAQGGAAAGAARHGCRRAMAPRAKGAGDKGASNREFALGRTLLTQIASSSARTGEQPSREELQRLLSEATQALEQLASEFEAFKSSVQPSDNQPPKGTMRAARRLQRH